VELPFAIDMIAFCEEEGVRFQTPYIGSRAAAGLWPDDLLARRDARGCALGDALRAFGGSPERIAEAAYDPRRVVAYLETHIEQGPVLEREGLPLGVVTGIAGQTRAGLTFRGQAGHAGTVPMSGRRDALAAAAQWLVEVEELARRQSGLVATVGRLEVKPGAINVIPGEVYTTLDVRHLDDAVREAAAAEILRSAELICRARSLEFKLDWLQHEPAVQCDAPCIGLLEQAVTEAGLRPLRLPSGAGHDAVLMGKRFPAGMLFVRCAGGVSHHPDESVAEADVAVALEVLWRWVMKLAEEEQLPRR
jgi:allantoate deiminase